MHVTADTDTRPSVVAAAPHLGVAFLPLCFESPASSGRKGAGAVGTGWAAVTLVGQRVKADFAITRHKRPLTATKEPGQ